MCDARTCDIPEHKHGHRRGFAPNSEARKREAGEPRTYADGGAVRAPDVGIFAQLEADTALRAERAEATIARVRNLANILDDLDDVGVAVLVAALRATLDADVDA